MKKALVTGGAGFLGSHIADALTARGYDVTIFDRAESRWRQASQKMLVGDISDPEQVKSAVRGHDVVYHLAALADLNAGKTRPVDTARINILGTLNVLEGIRADDNRPRMMFASTIYVFSREGGFYRCSKQACESYIEEYERSFGVRATILRYGSLYGPRADAANGLYRLLKQSIETGVVDYGGSPDDVREYIHVEDAANLSVDAAGDDFVGKHLVLTGNQPTRASDLFTMFSELLGKKLEVRYAHKQHGHYAITPYTFTPKAGRKLTTNHYVDMGQGLLHVVEQLHHEMDRGKS